MGFSPNFSWAAEELGMHSSLLVFRPIQILELIFSVLNIDLIDLRILLVVCLVG